MPTAAVHPLLDIVELILARGVEPQPAVVTEADIHSLPAPGMAASSDPGPSVGSTLGKCLLIEAVGRGASAKVFRALHTSLNIQVAVKVLTAGSAAGERRLREFSRVEAQLLARLNHPHIVRVLDYEQDPHRPFLVLEYVDGLTLADLIHQGGAMRAHRAVRLIAQVVDALGYALGMGVLHRDIKPANILLTREGSAKLADLGLAAVTAQSELSGVAVGGGDYLVGTPAYMAPEQALGTGSADHRSDIYSLGATFYHAVTGRPPFAGSGTVELMTKHARQMPEPPHKLMPELPPAVSALILKMLAKQPADRFADYEELSAALTGLRQSFKSGAAAPGGAGEPQAAPVPDAGSSREVPLPAADPNKPAKRTVVIRGRRVEL